MENIEKLPENCVAFKPLEWEIYEGLYLADKSENTIKRYFFYLPVILVVAVLYFINLLHNPTSFSTLLIFVMSIVLAVFVVVYPRYNSKRMAAEIGKTGKDVIIYINKDNITAEMGEDKAVMSFKTQKMKVYEFSGYFTILLERDGGYLVIPKKYMSTPQEDQLRQLLKANLKQDFKCRIKNSPVSPQATE